MRCTLMVGTLLVGGLAALTTGVATGQPGPRQAPAENRGLRYEALPSLDLTGQIEGMAGRQFRMRRLTVEPGGATALHDHRDRPAILYILEGVLTEHREGGDTREHRAGQAVTEPIDTRHWVENRGSVPAVLVSVDLYRP